MKLEQIQELWADDAVIDRTALTEESMKIPKLHSKYFKVFSHERLLLRTHEQDMQLLRHKKFEFYTQGPTKETMEAGWVLPSIGKIIRSDIEHYLNSDPDIMKLQEKIIIQKEKVDFLESILKQISARQFIINGMIAWEKFKVGQ